MKNTLLLVFIHGFKGNDHTFHNFPRDLRALIAHTLPNINVVSIQYPQYETKGDLRACVAKFKEWLQNKVIDLEVANRTPSPTVDPSVHVVLCGHSMGGIVAAEALLSIAGDTPVPSFQNDISSNTTATQDAGGRSSPPPVDSSRLFFPYIQAVMAFDTPFLGLNPGILAHSAEENGTTAYNAFNAASSVFGWNSPKSSTPSPIPDASSKGLPAPSAEAAGSSRWMKKYAMYGGAAAALAGVAGAATYMNWNHINNGLSWAGSHLEFVGCLARGAELQKRVEKVVALERTHGVGFTNFYGALGEKVAGKTKYAGAFVDSDRTFCVVPKRKEAAKRAGSKRRSGEMNDEAEGKVGEEMEQGEQVQEFVQDVERSKGKWVKCVNQAASDEINAHTAIFAADKNPDYHAMVPRARDQIVEWIGVESEWYLKSKEDDDARDEGMEDVSVGAEEDVEDSEDVLEDSPDEPREEESERATATV